VITNKRKENTQEAQTIDISPLCGDHAPEPIDMPFTVLTLVRDVIIPIKCHVDQLYGFLRVSTPKSAISYCWERPLQQLCTTVHTGFVSTCVLCSFRDMCRNFCTSRL